MTKLLNAVSLTGGFLGGVLGFMFGGFDVLLYALIILVVLDYITGFAKGVYTKTLSSETGFKGLIKKSIIFVVVVVSVVLQRVLNNAVPLSEITLMFFICNEGISILENSAEFVPIPQKLKDVLLQLRTDNDKKADEEGGDE